MTNKLVNCAENDRNTWTQHINSYSASREEEGAA
jgi:hypothetical protein